MSNKNTQRMGNGRGTQVLAEALEETAAAAAEMVEQEDDGRPGRRDGKTKSERRQERNERRRQLDEINKRRAGNGQGPVKSLAELIAEQQKEAQEARERHAAKQSSEDADAELLRRADELLDGPDSTETLPPTSATAACKKCRHWCCKIGERAKHSGHHPHCPLKPKTPVQPKADSEDDDNPLLPADAPLSAARNLGSPAAATLPAGPVEEDEEEDEAPVVVPPLPAPPVTPKQVWATPKPTMGQWISATLLAAVPEAAKKRVRAFAIGLMASALLAIAAIWWFGFLSTVWAMFVGSAVCLAYAFVGDHIRAAIEGATTLALRLKLGARLGLFVAFTAMLLSLPWGPGFGWVVAFCFLWLMSEVVVLNLRLDSKPVEVTITRETV